MSRQAVILAGGFGTRLQSVVADIPKPMASVAGVPFLEHVLANLMSFGVDHSVLSVGFQHETIRKHFGSNFRGMQLAYEVEDEPLGTGGAVVASARHITEKSYFVINGDTLFKADLGQLREFHASSRADISIAVREMHDFDRYGTVAFGDDGRINGFREREPLAHGHINGGIYLINAGVVEGLGLPERFSMEKDAFEAHVDDLALFAFPTTAYFIDIGIPEDYERAQHELG